MKKNKTYTVQAFRWGHLGEHSYIVGVYAKKNKALNAAKEEAEYRGGKYTCEVREWEIGISNDDPRDPKMPSKEIKSPERKFNEKE